MQVPGARKLLDAWERGLREPPAVRALLLLSGACPEKSFAELAELPIAARDLKLLELRERLFGPVITTVSTCPSCSLVLEATLAISDIRVGDDALVCSGTCEAEDYRVTFRMPSSADLLALLEVPRSQAPALLLRRCIVDAHHAAEADLDVAALPETVRAAVFAHMSSTMARADLELGFACSTCGQSWNATFDVASFLWQELHAWAKRTLTDIAQLGRLYGWNEAEALDLSPTRRRIYLELAGA